MYITIRFILIIIGLIIFLIILKNKQKKLTLKLTALIAIISLSLFLILIALPFEREFLGFNSPEKAFHYMNFNNIIKIAETDDCAFIIYGEDGSSVSYTYTEKINGKWRIHNPNLDDLSKKTKLLQKYFITSIKIPNSNKKCIIVSEGNLQHKNTTIDVKDNLNSEFTSFYCKYSNMDVYTLFYYSIIDSNDSNYQLSVNGEIVNIA